MCELHERLSSGLNLRNLYLLLSHGNISDLNLELRKFWLLMRLLNHIHWDILPLVFHLFRFSYVDLDF